MLSNKILEYGEKSNMESEKEKGEDGDDPDGDYRKTPPLIQGSEGGM
jgi:hypothetical protein